MDNVMPIYAYRCKACGFKQDVLQKLSEAPLTQCPECGRDTFCKQLTAAGFQLKGSGWYVTDFRHNSGSSGAQQKEAPDASSSTSDSAASSPAGGSKGDAKSEKALASSSSSTASGDAARGDTAR